MKAWTTPTFWRLPRDSFLIGTVGVELQALRERPPGSLRQAPQRAQVVERLRRRSARRGSPGRCRGGRAGGGARGRVAPGVEPPDRRRPGARPDQAEQHAGSSSSCPAPFGPRKPKTSPSSTATSRSSDPAPLAVPPRQAAKLDRVGHGAPPSMSSGHGAPGRARMPSGVPAPPTVEGATGRAGARGPSGRIGAGRTSRPESAAARPGRGQAVSRARRPESPAHARRRSAHQPSA